MIWVERQFVFAEDCFASETSARAEPELMHYLFEARAKPELMYGEVIIYSCYFIFLWFVINCFC